MASGSSRHGLPAWRTAASRVDFDGGASSSSGVGRSGSADTGIGFMERALSAASAAFLSAVLVNPLDVAKTRLQAQAAGVDYYRVASGGTNAITDMRRLPSSAYTEIFRTGNNVQRGSFQYKGTLDVLCKIVRQEGFATLWRGTNAGLTLAIPTVGIYLPCYDIFRNWIEEFTTCNAPSLTPYAPLVAGSVSRSLACITCSPIELAKTRMQAYKEFKVGAKPPGMWKTLVGVLPSVRGSNKHQNVQGYHLLWTGVGAQLARDVPFSAICWSTLEPIRRKLFSLVPENGRVSTVFGANFSAGFVAGSLAAAATCPLDVVKTRRQIQKDPLKSLNMRTWETLVNVWRSAGVQGLFTGVGPRVGRAGPSVGLVVSFYEVVKHILHPPGQMN